MRHEKGTETQEHAITNSTSDMMKMPAEVNRSTPTCHNVADARVVYSCERSNGIDIDNNCHCGNSYNIHDKRSDYSYEQRTDTCQIVTVLPDMT